MAIQDSGSNYQFYDKLINSYVSRSAFDLSRLHTTTLDFGQLIPVDMFWTLPNDDFDIRIEHLLRAMPMVCPPMSRMRIFFHTYYMTFDQLYKHWQTFMSKGRTGKYTSTLPTIKLSSTVTAGSLANYLGLPIGLTPEKATSIGISALPFAMYQRIYRDYYLPANLMTTDEYWFPADEENLKLTDGLHQYIYESDSKIQLDTLRFRDYVNDYFTSSLPFPMRGDSPSIGLGGNAPVYVKDYGKVYFGVNDTQRLVLYAENENQSGGYQIFASSNDGAATGSYNYGAYPAKPLVTDLSNISAVTLDQLRELSVAQRLMEKMARTDGSYGQFVKTFFDEYPKSAKDYRATYVGGTYAPIVTTEVLQTGESGTTPQGNMAGHGISSADGYIGHLHSDDFGICMTLASVMPDSMYCQGIGRDWTRKTQEEFYIPERSGLGPQAVLNQEIYFDSNNPTGLFSYQDRFDEYRYRENIVSGKVADHSNLSFFPYTQARYFNSEPTLSPSFTTTENNVRKDSFYAPTEVPFVLQVASKVRAVRPLPYKSTPAGLF